MSSSIYISTTEPGSGKALIALGILEFVLQRTSKVGFFRPIIHEVEPEQKNQDIDLILNYFNLNQSYRSSFGVDYSQASRLIGNQNLDKLLEIIIAKYKALEKQCDFILCEGSDYVASPRKCSPIPCDSRQKQTGSASSCQSTSPPSSRQNTHSIVAPMWTGAGMTCRRPLIPGPVGRSSCPH